MRLTEQTNIEEKCDLEKTLQFCFPRKLHASVSTS